MTAFGPEYTKINTLYKRDPERRNVIIPGEWATAELAYLSDAPWLWTEKVDGTNIRLHWNGTVVTVGGRTDTAQVPARLVANLAPLLEPQTWEAVFGEGPATVYGEGYGAKIQSGGQYRQDQAVVVFDVLAGEWWLRRADVEDVAGKLGFDAVPYVAAWSLRTASDMVRSGELVSAWPGARIEGLVGRPAVDLFDRKGQRILAKIKVKDWRDYERLSRVNA